MKQIKKIISVLFIVNFVLVLQSCKDIKEGEAPSATTPTTPTTPSTPTTDPISTPTTPQGELDALAASFKADYTGANWTFPIGFKPASYMNGGSGGTVIGVCELYSDGSKKVWFNEEWWALSSTSSNAKKILYYHELGHCYFNRNHDSRTYSNGRPYSLMNPIIDPVLFYWNMGYSAYYISELGNSSLGGTMVTLSANSDPNYDYEIPVELVKVSMTYDDGSCDIVE